MWHKFCSKQRKNKIPKKYFFGILFLSEENFQNFLWSDIFFCFLQLQKKKKIAVYAYFIEKRRFWFFFSKKKIPKSNFTNFINKLILFYEIFEKDSFQDKKEHNKNFARDAEFLFLFPIIFLSRLFFLQYLKNKKELNLIMKFEEIWFGICFFKKCCMEQNWKNKSPR